MNQVTISSRDQFGDLLNSMKLNGHAVEVGTHLGEFADILLSTWKGERLTCIDPWKNDIVGYNDVISGRVRNRDWKQCVERLRKYGDRVRYLKMLSTEAVDRFKDESLDFVYIDANHKKEYVKDDVKIWWPKVRSGGILAGHDYDHKEFQIALVVEAFACGIGHKVFLTNEYPSSWVILK